MGGFFEVVGEASVDQQRCTSAEQKKLIVQADRMSHSRSTAPEATVRLLRIILRL